MNTRLPKSVATRTVHRYLRDLGCECVVKIKTQWLSSKNQQQRVDWYARYMHWTPEHCRKVIFYDESIFHALKRENPHKICRLEKEKLLPECIQQTNTGDGGKVGISAFGTAATKIYTKHVGGKLYCNVLQHQLKSSVAQMPQKIKYFSGRPTSMTHIKYREGKNRQLKVDVLDWARTRPGLNPIEMLWSILDKKLVSKPIYSRAVLIGRFQE